jgi:hypothetical protein
VSSNWAPLGGYRCNGFQWLPSRPRGWIPTGLWKPPGIHPPGPARLLILRRFQEIRGGFRQGWLPKKTGLTLAKLRASPPSIRFQPERNRTINGLAVFLSVVRLPLSPEKLSPSMVWRLFSWIIGRHLPLRKPVLSTSQNHLHARCWTPAGFRTGFWDPPSIHLKENCESHLPTHSPHHAFQIACICCMCRT